MEIKFNVVGRKRVETEQRCSHKPATFLMYHLPLNMNKYYQRYIIVWNICIISYIIKGKKNLKTFKLGYYTTIIIYNNGYCRLFEHLWDWQSLVQ